MQLSLFRVYESGESKFIFSEKEENMDSFIVDFKNEQELINYLSEMNRVYKPDGIVDQGHFVLYSKEETEDGVELIEQPMYYKDDFFEIVKKLNKKMLEDIDFLKYYVRFYPNLVDEKYRDRLSMFFNGANVYSIYKLNVDSYINFIYTDWSIRKKTRTIVNSINSYDESKAIKNPNAKVKTKIINNV